MFLSDRYVKGSCPVCHEKDQYGDNCENRIINNDAVKDVENSIRDVIKNEESTISQLFKSVDIDPETIDITSTETTITEEGATIVNTIANVDFNELQSNEQFVENLRAELISITAEKLGVSPSKINIEFSEGSLIYKINIEECSVNKKGDNCDECAPGYTGDD